MELYELSYATYPQSEVSEVTRAAWLPLSRILKALNRERFGINMSVHIATKFTKFLTSINLKI